MRDPLSGPRKLTKLPGDSWSSPPPTSPTSRTATSTPLVGSLREQSCSGAASCDVGPGSIFDSQGGVDGHMVSHRIAPGRVVGLVTSHPIHSGTRHAHPGATCDFIDSAMRVRHRTPRGRRPFRSLGKYPGMVSQIPAWSRFARL